MRDPKFINIDESELRKLNLTFEENTKINYDNGHRWEPREYNLNDILDENIQYWKDTFHGEGGKGLLKIMIAFHTQEFKSYNEWQSNIPEPYRTEANYNIDRFSYCSFRIKYYTPVASEIVYYPMYQTRTSNKNYYYITCCGEIIRLPKDEVDKVYIVTLGR